MTGDIIIFNSFQSTIFHSRSSTANGACLAFVGKVTLHVDANKEMKPILIKNLLYLGKLTYSEHFVLFTTTFYFEIYKINLNKIYLYFYIKSLRRVYYVLNYCATCALNLTMHHGILYWTPPGLTRLMIIGCTTYMHISYDKQTKLWPYAKCRLLVGHHDKFKAYKVGTITLWHCSYQQCYILWAYPCKFCWCTRFRGSLQWLWFLKMTFPPDITIRVVCYFTWQF